jgi:hypothetical protein
VENFCEISVGFSIFLDKREILEFKKIYLYICGSKFENVKKHKRESKLAESQDLNWKTAI